MSRFAGGSRASRLGVASLATATSLGLGLLAAWPIYQHPWLVVAAGMALVVGIGLAVAAARWRWSALSVVLALVAAVAVTVIPATQPQLFTQLGDAPLAVLARGIVEGVAAIALGWKQLLTLTLPVGTYQTVLVPAYVVFLVTAFVVPAAAIRGGRIAGFAAIPLLAPVAFGAAFGAAQASAPLTLGPLTLAAPVETALWIGSALLAGTWVAWASGADRRAALRRGRSSRNSQSGRGSRWAAAVVVMAASIVVALLAAPALDSARGAGREAIRDRTDPEIVLRERPSPLASYRVFKRDAAIDTPLFEVEVDGATPSRLRLAVLDAYDGVDVHVGSAEASRFTRLPSGERLSDPTRVSIRIGAGYADIWAPTAGLGSVPEFAGPRARDLGDAFFVNRATDAAIAAPPVAPGEASGLRDGDGYTAMMSAAADPAPKLEPDRDASADASNTGLEAMPEMAEWIRVQAAPSTEAGLRDLIDRLRSRGYLSHSLSEREGELIWIERLRTEYDATFSASAGGQSVARIEQLFGQLNARERAAGSDAAPRDLVAGVGDDEQFSVAAMLIARALGFESRIVLGVRLGQESATSGDGADVERVGPIPGVPDCVDTCTGENLAAWIEVRGTDGTWAPIDVTPQVTDPPGSASEGQRLPEYPSTPEQRDAREVDPPVGVGEPSDNAVPPEAQPSESQFWPIVRAIGLSAAGLGLLTLPLLFLPLAKRWRTRRRRREPEPELRALGAWYELEGAAIDLGVGGAFGASARANRGRDRGRSRRRDGAAVESRTARARRLAEAGFASAPSVASSVDAAVFSAGGVLSIEADAIWSAVEADILEFRRRVGWWRRLKARYSLRSYGLRFAESPRRRGESAREPKASAVSLGEVPS